MKIPAWIATAATAIGIALLPACDAVNLQEIKPGITSASEVKTRMGEPGFQHWNNDGTATWEYSRQPSGTQCYMITFGNDQIVKSMEQVLNDKNYAKVRDGLSTVVFPSCPKKYTRPSAYRSDAANSPPSRSCQSSFPVAGRMRTKTRQNGQPIL